MDPSLRTYRNDFRNNCSHYGRPTMDRTISLVGNILDFDRGIKAMTTSKIPSPKEALEQILEHGSRSPFRSEILKNQSEDPILNTQAKIAKTAIPVAELAGQAMELLKRQPTTLRYMPDWWQKERRQLLAQIKALKCNPPK